jgi:hypothetical protein
MKKTLTALVAAAGVVGFAGAAFADCSFHSAQASKPMITADAGQSTPVATTTATTATETAKK